VSQSHNDIPNYFMMLANAAMGLALAQNLVPVEK
jgi:hypothetical protein